MTAARRKDDHYPGAVAIKRAVAAAKAAGLNVGGLEIGPDGVIRILDRANTPPPPKDEWEEWDRAGKLG